MHPINVMTYTGKLVDILSIKPNDICIEDIAHSLALQCRYTGHIKEFYSVAQHCVLMSELDLPSDPMARLLHDAAETYISDLATQIKRNIKIDGRSIKNIEVGILVVIGEVFDVDFPSAWDDIIIGDEMMLKAESELLMNEAFQEMLTHGPDKTYDVAIIPWGWKQAKRNFTQRYNVLKKG